MAEEIRAKLSLDHAEAHKHAKELEHEFEEMGEQLTELREKGKEFGGELVGSFKGVLQMAAGIELASMVESFKSAGEEVFHAAAGLEDQEKAIRGVLMMIDEEGASLADLSEEAHHLNEEFASMSVSSGQSKDAIVEAFDEMAERTDMSTQKVKELTEEMSQAGRAVPGGIGSLSTGFSNLASGMIRAKNPIVQMITATGLLHGNAKEVAKQLQKMTPESAMKVGIAAVEQMSTKMKNVPLTFNEAIASFKTMREEVFEGIGTPLVRALTGPLGEIRDYFMENREEIQKWAEHAGEDAGRWLKEGFRYLEEHGTEIKQYLSDGASAVKEAALALGEVIHFMWDHREEIAVAYGATKVAGVVGGVAKMGGALAGGVAGLAGSGGMASAASSVVGNAGLIGGLVAEAAVLGYAINDQWTKLMHEMGSSMDIEAEKTEALRAANAGQTQEMETMISVLSQAGAATDDFVASLRQVDALHNEWQRDITSVHQGLYGGEIEMDKLSKEGQVSEIERKTMSADKAANQYAATFAAAHQEIFNTMAATGPEFLKYGHKLAEQIAQFNPEVAEALEVKLGAIEKKAARAASAGDLSNLQINNNFHGDIHIQQDFKDTNPDRVILEFKKELSRSALSRTSAATQTPHTAF